MKTFEFGSAKGKHLSEFGLQLRFNQLKENQLVIHDNAVHIILVEDNIYYDEKSPASLDVVAEVALLIQRSLNLKANRIHVHFDPPRNARNEVRILINVALSQALQFKAKLQSVHIHWSMLSEHHNPLQYGVLVDSALIVYHPE
jgi:hypothetical protein